MSGRYNPEQRYNRFETFSSHRNHPGQSFEFTHSTRNHRQPFLRESTDLTPILNEGEDFRSGISLASPMAALRANRRVKLEPIEDPSFIPPPPGDTGDRYEVPSDYSIPAEMLGDAQQSNTQRRKVRYDNDHNIHNAYETVGVLRHLDRYHSYDQDFERRLWEDNHASMLQDQAYVDPYHQHHDFSVGVDPFHPFPPSGVDHYPPSTSTELYRKRSASTDDETPDNDHEEMNMTPEAARFPETMCHKTVASFATRTTGGERTSEGTKELQLHPSPREIEFLPNPRAKDALEVWYQRLRELVAFKKEHGHSNVRQKYAPNPQLGIWVNKQRCTRHSLTRQKMDALEAVGFDWGTKKGEHAWLNKFNELIVYRKLHQNCLVPTKCSTNPSLGRWVSTQRAQYKLYRANQKTTMTAKKIEKLEKIGFAWSMVD